MIGEENWRDAPGWEGFFEVSSLGRVRSVDRLLSCRDGIRRRFRSVLRSQRSDRRGYKYITLKALEKHKSVAVHRLVCEAFHGRPVPPRIMVAHNDGRPSNNEASNLRWATAQENAADMVRHGTVVTRDSPGKAVMNSADLERFLERLTGNERQSDVARLAGVGIRTAARILRIKRDTIGAPVQARAKLSANDIAQAREMARSGAMNPEIARRFGVDTSTIWRALTRQG